MRLPTLDNKPMSGNIDEVAAIPLIRSAIEHGINYFDTGFPYHNGNSEIVTGKALLGYRDKVKLATKSPLWFINSADDFDKYLNEQLKKLQTDHIDFYLLHGIGKDKWENTVLKLGLLKKAEAALKESEERFRNMSNLLPRIKRYVINLSAPSAPRRPQGVRPNKLQRSRTRSG